MNIVQGSGVDASLNDLGRCQAQAFYNNYRHIPFDKVYTSSLRRSLQSVEGFIQDGISHETLPELNEISWGRKEGKRITPEADSHYRYILDEWKKGNTALSIEGGESPEEVLDRVGNGLVYMLSNPEERHILVCMHGRAMRILLCHMFDRPLRQMDEFHHANLGLYLVRYEKDIFMMERANDISHLSVLS
jgi:2,3-bisphosphoglycerate-dependent phosphoglycerate mutase